MITRAKVIFAIVAALFGGLTFFEDAAGMFIARNAPVVTGHVVSREPTTRFFVPNKVDFTIRIQGSDTQVHAIMQRNWLVEVPETVRFHYTGDPAQNVFLHEHEKNPWLLVLVFWGGALILIFMMRSGRLSKVLGWKKTDSHPNVA